MFSTPERPLFPMCNIPSPTSMSCTGRLALNYICLEKTESDPRFTCHPPSHPHYCSLLILHLPLPLHLDCLDPLVLESPSLSDYQVLRRRNQTPSRYTNQPSFVRTEWTHLNVLFILFFPLSLSASPKLPSSLPISRLCPRGVFPPDPPSSPLYILALAFFAFLA